MKRLLVLIPMLFTLLTGLFMAEPKTALATTPTPIPTSNPSLVWALTGSMHTPRWGYSLTLLPNGKVLAAGGFVGPANGNALIQTEIYDPATGQWTATGNMNVARYTPQATLLPNGKVLIVGGGNAGVNTVTCEIYDPATGQWSFTGSLNTARHGNLQVLLPNGKVLVAGGYNGSYLTSAELYDPATGTWTPTASLNVARHWPGGMLLANGKVLIVFGENNASTTGFELYDYTTGQWTLTTGSNLTYYGQAMVSLTDGRLLTAGGLDTTSLATQKITSIHDPNSTIWTAVGNLNIARYGGSMLRLLNGEVIMAGGINGDVFNGNSIVSTEIYNPTSQTWRQVANLNVARYYPNAIVLPDSRVLVAGGCTTGNCSTLLNSAELYGSAMPTPTPTPTVTNTPTNTPTFTPSPTHTATPTPTNTPTPMPTVTNTPTPTNTNTPTPLPTVTNTPTNTATPTNTPTPLPTVTNTATPPLVPTNPPTVSPTNTPRPTDTPTSVPANGNLSLNLIANKLIVQLGDRVNYTLVLTTNMELTAYLTTTLPFGLEVVTDSLPQGFTYNVTTRQLTYRGSVNGVLTLNYSVTVATNLAVGSPLYSSVEVTTSTGSTVQWRGDAVTAVIPDPTFRETLVLIYLGIDNNLDKAGSEAIIRLYQNCQANPHAKCWVLVDWKGANNAYLYRFDTGLPVTNSICPTAFNPTCNGQLQLGQNMWTWDENSTSPYSLAEAMAAMGRAYPNAKNSDQLIVSLVGHGGGWSNETLLAGQPQKQTGQPQKQTGQGNGGLLYEENPLSTMSLQDLRQALTIAQQQTGHKIGLLYLDMCLMSNLESLHELTGSADYVLASPNWAFAAFPYDKQIQAIDGQKDIKAIGQAWLNNQETALRQSQYPYIFSLIDMAKLPQLVAATEQLAQALLPHSQTIEGRAKMRQARLDSECFDSDENGVIDTNDYYCDLGSFAQQLQRQFSGDSAVQSATQAVMTGLAQTIILEKHNHQRFNNPYPWAWGDIKGTSIFIPLAEPTWQLSLYNGYELKFAEDTSWDTVLSNYWQGTTLPTTPIACTAHCTLPPIVQPLPTLLMPNLAAPANSTTTVPLNIINLPANSCLEAVNATVVFNNNIATFIKATATANMAGASISVNSNQPGLLRIAAIINNCRPFMGSGTLFNVTFQTHGTLGQSTPLTFLQGITQTTIYDQKDLVNPLNLNLMNGSLIFANSYMRGDVNGDGFVTAPDAAMALRHTVGKETLSLTQQNACDVNGDSRCNAADVSLILCYAAQQDWSACQQTVETRHTLPLQTATETTTLCLSAITQSGPQTLALKIMGAPDMSGVEVMVNYNPSQLTLSEPTKGNLTQKFLLDSHEAVSGELKIAMASNNAIGADGYLLQFMVTAQLPTATLTLSDLRLNNRAGQDFATNLQRPIVATTCKLSSSYLPVIQR